MKISIILPAYKKEFLLDSIKSILAQTYKNFELIIVNDASPENLEEVINQFADERIQYYKNSHNLGGVNLVENWNHCLNYANGEFTVLASDDDIYEKEFLEEMVKLVQKYPDVDLFHCRMGIMDAQNKVFGYSAVAPEFESTAEYLYHRAISRRMQAAPDFMFRTSAIRELGGFINFPLAFFSDDATYFSLASNKGVAFSEKVLFYWRFSGQNICGKKDNLLQKAEASFLYKNWLLFFLKKIIAKNDMEKYFLEETNRFYKSTINQVIIGELVQLPFKLFLALTFNAKIHKFIDTNVLKLLYKKFKRFI